MVNAGRALVDSLIANGVEFFSCVPGESFLPLLDALYEHGAAEPGGDVTLITARHESAAGFMAEAAAKASHRPAACLVTRGPGAMHAAIAVHTAHQDGTPLILAIGQVNRDQRGREAFQEMDYPAVFASTAKLVVEIQDPGRVPEIVARAVHVATSGRPGPVVLALPEDMLYEATAAAGVVAPPRRPVPPPAQAAREIATRLQEAERPLVVVGGPTWKAEAGRDVLLFAERAGLPVATTFRYQDAVDNRSPHYVGYLGLAGSRTLYERAAASDAWLLLGPRPDDPSTDGFALLDHDRIHRHVTVVTDDAAEATQSMMPDAIVTCSPAELAAELGRLELTPQDRHRRDTAVMRQEHLDYVSRRYPDLPVDLAAVIAHVRAEVPDDAVVTNGAGNYTGWLQRFFEFRTFGTQIAPHNGAMAYGVPAAIAVSAINPGRTVVAFAGDGCFMMSGNELATAVQHGVRLVVVIVENGLYGTIRMHQEHHFPGRTISTRLRNPDFVSYARAFGAAAWRVQSTEEFPAAFAGALAHDGVAVIAVETDPAQITPESRLGDASS